MEEEQIVQLALVGTAAVLAIIAVVLIVFTVRFRRRAVSTTGTVVGFQESHSSEGGTTYKPVIRYRVGEQELQIVDSMSSNPPAYEVGEIIDVKYDPQRPTKAKPDRLFRTWFAPGLLLLLAVIFVGAAVFVDGVA